MLVEKILEVKKKLNSQKKVAQKKNSSQTSQTLSNDVKSTEEDIIGNVLYTVKPNETLLNAVRIMAEKDIGSIVVQSTEKVEGIVTFKELIYALEKKDGALGHTLVSEVMNKTPLVCGLTADLNEVRRMMLENHARYLIVIDKSTLWGVISFYDVAQAIVDEQDFENKALKAYIRDWPEEDEQSK